jgi:hypothetical protein
MRRDLSSELQVSLQTLRRRGWHTPGVLGKVVKRKGLDNFALRKLLKTKNRCFAGQCEENPSLFGGWFSAKGESLESPYLIISRA